MATRRKTEKKNGLPFSGEGENRSRGDKKAEIGKWTKQENDNSRRSYPPKQKGRKKQIRGPIDGDRAKGEKERDREERKEPPGQRTIQKKRKAPSSSPERTRNGQ